MVANFAAGGAAINQLARAAGAQLRVVPLDDRRADGRLHQAAAMDEAGLPRRRGGRLRRGRGGHRPALLRRDGDRQHHRRGSRRGSLVRRAGREMGRARHRRRRQRARSQGGRRRCRAGAPSRRCSPIPCGSLRRSAVASWLPCSAPPFPRGCARCRCCSTVSSVTAAVAPLASIDPAALDHVQAAHVSAETPHRRLLDLLGLSPLLDLGMRLGEASGACLAVNVVRSACACFAGMASFDRGGRFGQRGPLRTSPVRWRTNAQRKDNCSISAFLPLWALERARGGPAQGVDVQAGRAALTVRSRGLAA